MNKKTKRWLIAAAVLLFVGALVFVGALAKVGFDFSRLSTQKSETKTYEFKEDFEHILVNAETDTVTLLPSTDGVCKVECTEEKNLKHVLKIQNNTLMIEVIDSRKWYDYIGIHIQTPSIKIYLPKSDYSSLLVSTGTGDVEVSDKYRFETVSVSGSTANISCNASVSKSLELHTTTGEITVGPTKTESVKLTATTGEITVNDVACHDFSAINSTAEIILNNVIAKESLSVENTTGGVTLLRCDANTITVKSSTGSVKGSLLSEKIFLADSETGSIHVPKTTSGGKCEITTITGDIEIEIVN